mgnify:CR=1 FL=1
MESILDKIYKYIAFFIEKIIGNCAALMMFLATGLAVVEIFRRYILGITFEWGQDAVSYFMISALFLYFCVTQLKRSHLAMRAAVDAINKKGFTRVTQLFRILTTILIIYISANFSLWGIPIVERAAMLGRKSQSMILDIWPFQLCLVVGFGLMAVVGIFQLYQDIQEFRGKSVFSWAPKDEELDI